MKKEFMIFAAILAVIFSVAVFGRKIILDSARERIKGAFPGCEVSISDPEIKGIDLISFSNVNISKGDAVGYRVKELDVRFNPFTLFNRRVPKVSLNNCSISLDSPSGRVRDLIELPSLKADAVFLIDRLEINELVLEVHTADCELSAVIRADASIKKDIAYDAVIKVDNVDLGLLAGCFGVSSGGVKLGGSASGELALTGRDLKLTSINGRFTSGPRGGTIDIRDEDLIKAIAGYSNRTAATIRGDFRDYNYSKGMIEVSKSGDAVLLRLKTDGKQGGRDLTMELPGL